MDSKTRQNSLRILMRTRGEASILLCREVEAAIHSLSTSRSEYVDLLKRSAFNMLTNHKLKEAGEIVHSPDSHLAKGTALDKMEIQKLAKNERFQAMLREKYEAIDDTKFEALVRCRRCGSAEVSWDEKQTRSADEAATLFCVCNTCKNRWVMR